MTAIFMEKRLDALRAIDAQGVEAMNKVKPGQTVRVEIRRSRSPQHHKLFWVLVTLVHKNLPERYCNMYPRVENLVDAIKIATGHFEPIVSLDGKVVGQRPKSMAFHSMGQDEFHAFFECTCDLLIQHFLPEVGKDELIAEVQQIIGMRSAA